MEIEQLRLVLLGKPEVEEDFPFRPDVPVFKVCKKMFALYSFENDGTIRMNLKCDPQEALMLRDVFEDVIPGYHMNKKHWNTVIINGSIPNREIERMIDHSYGLVVKGLAKKTRRALEIKYGEDVIYGL